LTPAYTRNDSLGKPWRVNWRSNGYRLPTEAEWEYAARGGKKTKGYTYAGSNTIDDVAWYNDNSGYTSHTVGTKKANELGLYDMSGNVEEWCWSNSKKEFASNSQIGNYEIEFGGYQVVRGGSFNSSGRSGWAGDECNLEWRSRYSNYANSNNRYIGFRVVRP
jgi:formylglycine-generating enzyme required for sulfatase activity